MSQIASFYLLKDGRRQEPVSYTHLDVYKRQQQYFGKVENVFHELVSPDIHVDICMVPPPEERDYCTLVTMGMGAHRMLSLIHSYQSHQKYQTVDCHRTSAKEPMLPSSF